MLRARTGMAGCGAGLAAALGMCCASVIAQPAGRADGERGAAGGRGVDGPGVRRIEAGTADRDPARTSLRSLQRDLRAPTGFESVYQIDRADAFGTRETSFMRIDGNLHAVFPRSVYLPTSRGSVAVVPPGTTFFIGAPPSAPTAAPARGLRHREGYVDLSLPLRAEVRSVENPGGVVPRHGPEGRGGSGRDGGAGLVEMSLFESESYHGYRVADLLLRARAAEKRGEGAAGRGIDRRDGGASGGQARPAPGPAR